MMRHPDNGGASALWLLTLLLLSAVPAVSGTDQNAEGRRLLERDKPRAALRAFEKAETASGGNPVPALLGAHILKTYYF